MTILALAAQFAAPPAVYRPMVFWIWNGEITKAAIDRDIAEMQGKGCGGFFIHPMGENFRLRDFIRGLSPPYLSNEYFALVRYAVQRAEAAGLYAWLYDEGGWPSGTAQGAVVAGHPELAGKVLVATQAPPGPNDTLVATLRLRRHGKPELLQPGAPAGDGPVVHFVARVGGYPVDMMDLAAVRRFIEVTHERYREYVGEYFGGTVPGIFTDEPRVGGSVGSQAIPWTPTMLKAFEAHHGFDLRPWLPLLFAEDAVGCNPVDYYTEGEQAAVRCAFYDTWTRLYREAYWDTINAWCHKHGLLHVGHVGGEDNLPDHARHGFGEFFRTAGTLHVPGVDAIWRQIWPTEPRLHFPLFAASAAHQKAPGASVGAWPSSGLALTESFGVYGFGLTFAGMKWVTDYQFARGINVLCPMAYSLCTQGGRLYRTMDYMGPGNPLWAYYAEFAQYVARLSLICRAGESTATIAIYYPVEDLWANPNSNTAGSFETLCGLLEDQQVPFDVIGGDALMAASTEDQLLVTPGAAYELVIVPEMTYMRLAVAQRLARFRSEGGRIVVLNNGPVWALDGARAVPMAEAVPELLAGAYPVDLPKEQDSLMAAFGSQPARWMVSQFDGFSAAYHPGYRLDRFAGRRLIPGVTLQVLRDKMGQFAELLGVITPRLHLGLRRPVEGLRLLTRALEHGSLHLLVNEREEEAKVGLLVTAEEPLRIETWDPDTGCRRVLGEHREVREATPVEFTLAGHQSLILVLTPPELLDGPDECPKLSWRRNLGTLSLAQPIRGYTIQDGDVTPLASLPLLAFEARLCRGGRWDELPGLRHFSGTMEYQLTFDAETEWVERPSVIEIADVMYVAEAWLNGQALGTRIWPPYRWETTGVLRKGRNELVAHVTNTLANEALRPEVMDEAKARGWWNTYRERSQPMMEESLPSGVAPEVLLWLADRRG
ncbi:MAG: glycosyl hydrolase [Candidatus Zipacnadales bacterium]